MRRSRSEEALNQAGSMHCLVCWSPQIGYLRLIAHTYRGDCKLTPCPEAVRLPPSQGSLFDSATSRDGRTAAAPARPRVLHTSLGYTRDAELSVLTLPQRMQPPEDSDHSYCWRAYVLPYDPVSHLAFTVSMMEGREGRGMSMSESELKDPWTTADIGNWIHTFLQKQRAP